MQPRKPRLAFIATEDWFFAERFLVMGQVALSRGFDVTVIARERTHRAMIEAAGMSLIALEAERRSINPLDFAQGAVRLSSILKTLAPDLVHCIAIKAIVMGGIACNRAGITRRIYAPTGLGVFADGHYSFAKAARAAMVAGVRRGLETPQTRYLFENARDPVSFGLDPGDKAKVTIVGGAGIDPDFYVPEPMPALPPLKVAIVSRMLHTKGINTAVEAVGLARKAGADVTLSLYGAPDDASVQSISKEQLQAWSKLPGITWHGATQDVKSVWRAHHVCCVPSRGGEGLPRALLEGAASGRALLTTNVPGCGDFARDGIEGRVVAMGDAASMGKALVAFAQWPADLASMGAAARARVVDGYTLADVARTVGDLYDRMKPKVTAA